MNQQNLATQRTRKRQKRDLFTSQSRRVAVTESRRAVILNSDECGQPRGVTPLHPREAKAIAVADFSAQGSAESGDSNQLALEKCVGYSKYYPASPARCVRHI